MSRYTSTPRLLFAVFAASLIASTAQAAITVTNIAHASFWPTTAGANVSIPVGTAIAAGDLEVVEVYQGSGNTGFATATDDSGTVLNAGPKCSAPGGFGNGDVEILWAVSAGLTTSQHITLHFTSGGADVYGAYSVVKATGATWYGTDGTACASIATSATSAPSGNVTPTHAGELLLGAAVSKFNPSAWVQSTGFTTPPIWSGSQVNDAIGGQIIDAGTTTENYDPTTSAGMTGGAASALIAFTNTPPPFNPHGGGLLGVAPTITSTLNDGCSQAPAPAAAAGFCRQTWAVRPGEWSNTFVDQGLTYAGTDRAYYDQCFGQNPATGAGNTTLNVTNGAVGQASGGYGATLASATCKGTSWVGTAFGGGGYFEITTSFTSTNHTPDWQGPAWLWGLECSTAPVLVGCNWTNQQTNFAISSASYVSATGVLSVTTSSAATLTQFDSAILTSLTGTGAFASLQGDTCTIPNVVTASTSFVLDCPIGLGTLALTGGNVGQVYYYFDEFDDIESFMGNFGDPLSYWQQSLHSWSKPDKSLNFSQITGATPGQASFSSPHTYGLLWKVATASTPGSACMYYDGTQINCYTWTQFINNGAQAAPAAYTVSSGSYNSTTGVITLTTSASTSVAIGSSPILQISSGTGNTSALVGNWVALSGTTGTTVVLQGPTGQGSITITAGVLGQPWAMGIADLQHFIFYSGCTTAFPCADTTWDVWQKDSEANLVQYP